MDATPPNTPLTAPSTEAVDTSEPRQLSIEEVLAKFTSISPVKQSVGPLDISVQADPSRGQAVVTANLAGTTLLTQLLCACNPTLALDIAIGACSAKGNVSILLLDAPGFCAITMDIIARQSDSEHPYRGDVTHWVATELPVVAEFVVTLTDELTTLTTVRGLAANQAEFQFCSADGPVIGAQATQFAPVRTFPTTIEAGIVKIEPLAQITLAIPSTISPGFLFLQATFSSVTTPSTRIASSVANWSLPMIALAQLSKPRVSKND